MDNGIYTDADLADANIEVTQLMAEIDKIANNTNFNSVNLLMDLIIKTSMLDQT